MDADATAAERARLLRPGGYAVATTWEALSEDAPLPEMVFDYELGFRARRSCGQNVRRTRRLERTPWLIFYRALLEREDALREDMGEAASDLLEEARDGLARSGKPPRVRKVFIVAQRD